MIENSWLGHIVEVKLLWLQQDYFLWLKIVFKTYMICHYFMVAMDVMVISFVVFIVIFIIILFADQRTTRTTTAASVWWTTASRAAAAAWTWKRTGRASRFASRQTASTVLGFNLIHVLGFFKNVALKQVKLELKT